MQVFVRGADVVLLADVFGVAEENEPEQEWISTDGGATFVAVDEGKSVADGILNADTQPLNAVEVPGSNVLGYGWFTAPGAPPTFNAFPMFSPPVCSVKACAAGFAELEPNTNPDQIQNIEGQFASQFGSAPGVMGVFETLFTSGPLGCTGSFGTAFVYASGNQSSSNNYNISPGSPNSAWKVPVTQADCGTEYPAVAGGPSGFGVVEDELATGFTIYHPFDQTHQDFDTPDVTIARQSEISPSVSQDEHGGIYTTYIGPFGAIRLAYSSTGGASWTGPATLNPDTGGGAGNLISSVGSNGQGWAVWADGGSVYAQQFDAADAIPPTLPTTLATSQTSGTTTGANITIPAGTVGETDQVAISGTNATLATGTVAYSLYSSSSCTGTPVFTSSGAVTAGKAAPSAPITSALAPGSYYWWVAYGGDSRNLASASTCGSEVLTVAATSLLTIPKQNDSVSSKGNLSVVVDCAGAPCSSGSITLLAKVKKTTGKGKKKKTKTVVETIGTVSFSSLALGTDTIAIKLNSTGLKLLKHDGYKLKSTASATYLSGKVFQTATGELDLKGHKPKKKKK